MMKWSKEKKKKEKEKEHNIVLKITNDSDNTTEETEDNDQLTALINSELKRQQNALTFGSDSEEDETNEIISEDLGFHFGWTKITDLGKDEFGENYIARNNDNQSLAIIKDVIVNVGSVKDKKKMIRRVCDDIERLSKIKMPQLYVVNYQGAELHDKGDTILLRIFKRFTIENGRFRKNGDFL